MVAGMAAGGRPGPGPEAPSPSAGLHRGGEIVASDRSEPRSFNRLAARDTTTVLVATLTQAKLVRVNQATQEVEPWLAESWTASPDARGVTLKLRRDVVFSDGHPFTADDVVFTFDAAYDGQTHGGVGDSLRVAGKKLKVVATDPQTVTVTFPEPFAAGVRLLDNLPMLPRHKLEAALKSGTFSSAWGLSTPLSEIVALGPFVVARYVPGPPVWLVRNPHYFSTASDGGALPYVDRGTIDIIPDQNAEMLRLEAGQIDTMPSEIPPEADAPVQHPPAPPPP